MLHLGRGVALRMDVGDLLELERTFERHRKVVAAAEVEDVARPHHALGDLLHLGGPCEHPLHQLRESGESAHHLAPLENKAAANAAKCLKTWPFHH